MTWFSSSLLLFYIFSHFSWFLNFFNSPTSSSSLTDAYWELTKFDIPAGSLVTILHVCVFHGNKNLLWSKPHHVLSDASLWCDSDTVLAQGYHGVASAASEQPSPVQSLQLASRWPLSATLVAFHFPFYPRLNGRVAGSSHAFPSEPSGACSAQSESCSPSKFFWCFSRGWSMRSIYGNNVMHCYSKDTIHLHVMTN